jgi:hypothetical protein
MRSGFVMFMFLPELTLCQVRAYSPLPNPQGFYFKMTKVEYK